MRFFIVALCLILCLFVYPQPSRADLAVGQRFANLTFSGTLYPEDRAYLGLSRPGEFSLKDIQAQYILLEIFSESCPHCIVAAPRVNRLFRLIEDNPRLRGGKGRPAVLKMMGVGFYSKRAAMEVWRIRHDSPFPLIPDPQAQVGRALDIPGVPTFVVLDRDGRVVFMHAGDIGNPRRFLGRILEKLEY